MPLNIIQPVQPINWQGISQLTNNLRENKLLRKSEALSKQALGGDANALSGLYGVNPHAAKFIQEQQQTAKKERQAEGMNFARGAIISLLQAPAEQRPQLWQQAVGRGKQQYGEMFGEVPDEYSDQAFNEILSRASEDKILSKVLEQRLGLQSGEGYAPSFKIDEITLPNGMKQRVVFDQRSGQTQPHGEPYEAKADSAAAQPASLQEIAWLEQATPEQRALYWENKRAPTALNLGGSQLLRTPGGQETSYDVTQKQAPASLGVTPDAAPEIQAQQAAQAEAMQAEATERAKQQQQQQFAGPIKEAEAAGTLRGKGELPEAEQKATERRMAFNLYETARAGLLSGLEGAETGPMIGRIPPVTAAQQTAQGGVSAMGPVLKQLFRAAGEGIFTDRDQQLLLEMVPDRRDLPKAREAKIQNIDNIVRAKLGMTDGGKTTPPPSDQPKPNGKVKSRAWIDAYVRQRESEGMTLEEAMRRAKAAGYTVQ